MFAEHQVVIVRLYVASGTESVGRVVLQLLQVSCSFNLYGGLGPGLLLPANCAVTWAWMYPSQLDVRRFLRLSGWLCDVRFPTI